MSAATTLRREVLAGDDDAPRRWPVVALVAVLVLAFVMARADGWMRGRELGALADRVEAGRDALAQGEGQVSSLLQYAWPTLSRPDLDPAVRDDVAALVRRAEADAAALAVAARRDLDDMTVVPWHGDVTAARDAYGAYLDARIATFEAAASDLATRSTVPLDHDATLARAVEAAAAAAASDPDAAARLVAAMRAGPGA